MNALEQMVQVALGDDYELLKEIGYIQPVQKQVNDTKITSCPINSLGWMVTILEKQYENSFS